MAAIAVVCGAFPQFAAAQPKNVILMISDGGGFNAYLGTESYLGAPPVYRTFGVHLGMTNYEWDGSFDPASMWSSFTYPTYGYTDSAAAATAMNSGQKTNGGNILYDVWDTWPLVGIAEIADARALATGVVSSVEFSHATPAAVFAHNVYRGNYAQIANEMIYDSGLDVIMGCGNPDYNNNGDPATGQDPKYVGGWTTWADVIAGTANGFAFVSSKEDFEALADGSYNGGNLPDKIIGCPCVYKTLQYYRAGGNNPPYVDPLIPTVPTLQTMTLGALNILSQNADGFFLMVEGGAVDWAGHGNKLGRQIEEQIDFVNSIQAVVDWVNSESSWDDTLVIVTADHETGHLWGPIYGQYNPLADNGPGMMPGHSWNSTSHTNQLVPLFAEGADSELLLDYIEGHDPDAGAFWGFSGDYIDNTDLFPVMKTRFLGTCWSDVDGDGVVNVLDLLALLAAWDTHGGLADVNADGIVDHLDLVELMSNWGPCA